jgi:hypothetical protein
MAARLRFCRIQLALHELDYSSVLVPAVDVVQNVVGTRLPVCCMEVITDPLNEMVLESPFDQLM